MFLIHFHDSDNASWVLTLVCCCKIDYHDNDLSNLVNYFEHNLLVSEVNLVNYFERNLLVSEVVMISCRRDCMVGFRFV